MIKTSLRNKYAARYLEWQATGAAPKTRDAALKIIKSELTKVNIDFEATGIRKGLARSISDGVAETEINSNLGFIVWDLTVNNGKAIDYRIDSNYLSGLLAQAHSVLTNHRFVIKTSITPSPVGSSLKIKSFSVPASLHVPGVGRRAVIHISTKRLTEIIEEELSQLKVQVMRWQKLGASMTQVKRALRIFNKQVLSMYTEAPKPVLLKKPVKSAKVLVPSVKAAFINRN